MIAVSAPVTPMSMPAGDGAPLLIDPVTGAKISPDAMPLHLRKARTTAVSIDANAGICRGMLKHRYQESGQGEESQ